MKNFIAPVSSSFFEHCSVKNDVEEIRNNSKKMVNSSSNIFEYNFSGGSSSHFAIISLSVANDVITIYENPLRKSVLLPNIIKKFAIYLTHLVINFEEKNIRVNDKFNRCYLLKFLDNNAEDYLEILLNYLLEWQAYSGQQDFTKPKETLLTEKMRGDVLSQFLKYTKGFESENEARISAPIFMFGP